MHACLSVSRLAIYIHVFATIIGTLSNCAGHAITFQLVVNEAFCRTIGESDGMSWTTQTGQDASLQGAGGGVINDNEKVVGVGGTRVVVSVCTLYVQWLMFSQMSDILHVGKCTFRIKHGMNYVSRTVLCTMKVHVIHLGCITIVMTSITYHAQCRLPLYDVIH